MGVPKKEPSLWPLFAARTAASLLGYSAHVVRQPPLDVEGPDRRLAAVRQDEGALVGHPVSEDRLVGQVNPALRLGIVCPVPPRARHQLFFCRFFLCNYRLRERITATLYYREERGKSCFAAAADDLADLGGVDTKLGGDRHQPQLRLGGVHGQDGDGHRRKRPSLAGIRRGVADLGKPVNPLGSLPRHGFVQRDTKVVGGATLGQRLRPYQYGFEEQTSHLFHVPMAKERQTSRQVPVGPAGIDCHWRSNEVLPRLLAAEQRRHDFLIRKQRFST